MKKFEKIGELIENFSDVRQNSRTPTKKKIATGKSPKSNLKHISHYSINTGDEKPDKIANEENLCVKETEYSSFSEIFGK